MFLIPSGVTGSTVGSDPISVGSNPTGVILTSYLEKRDMEQETNNLESDPYKSQGFGSDFTQRIVNDFKGCIYRYCEISTERERTFCR